MKKSAVFDLPAYRVGPYEMRLKPATSAMFEDKRRVLENYWTEGYVLLHARLPHRKALARTLEHMIKAIHYRSGIGERCDEETYTHSLATGLVEIADRNPLFWREFNRLWEREYAFGAHWAEACDARNPARRAHRMPANIVYRGRHCHLKRVPEFECLRHGAYGFFCESDSEQEPDCIELSDGLWGVNLSIVSLHEVIHFLHSAEGIEDGARFGATCRTQAAMLARFWRTNPAFWRWWLFTLAREQRARTSLTHARRHEAARTRAEMALAA